MDDQARLWHEQNRMPKNPTPQQRVEWHVEHAKHCQCRPIPARVLALIEATDVRGDPDRK